MGFFFSRFFADKRIIRTKFEPKATTGIFGHVDLCNREGISGWVIDMSRPMSPLTIKAFLNGKLIGSALTDQSRSDIANLTGVTAHCGFLLRWMHCSLAAAKEMLPANGMCSLEVKVEGDPRVIASNIKVFKVEDIRNWLTGLDTDKKSIQDRQGGQMAMPTKAVAHFIDGMPGQQVEPLAREGDVKLIAYYLPQFHPIPENDEWWGAGFTEWTNVAQAMPYFKDHYQPHVPGELGYYDLRLPEIREAQAKLAKEYGIYGFCYYYYWFAGRRLLERPLQEVFESGRPDFPFCICWANENWSRRWDGSENEILVQQVHNEKTDEEFIHDVIPLFKDPRYIRLNSAPLLIIYRISLMPNPKKTAETWRRICAEEGIPHIHLCMSETFGLAEPRQYGFDSAVQFPPHGVSAGEVNDKVADLAEGYSGKIYDIRSVIQDQLAREAPTYKRFPGVMTSWDNTARKKKVGNIFLNSSPDNYEIWLRGAVDCARQRLPEGEKLVFINAWNEWAEGAHLEPDRKHGRAYLESTRRALTGKSHWRMAIDYAEKLPVLGGQAKETFLAEIRTHLERQDMVNSKLLAIMGDTGLPRQWVFAKLGLPFWMEGVTVTKCGVCQLDQLNHYQAPGGVTVGIDSFQKLYIKGWSFSSGIALDRNSPTYLVLEEKENNRSYHCLITGRLERQDVAQNYPKIRRDYVLYAGITIAADISKVLPGVYRIGIASRGKQQVVLTHFKTEIEIG